MTDTNFTDKQTVIQTDWLNDINDHVYNDTPISPAATVHKASSISNVPVGTVSSTNVQDALNEIVSDLSASSGAALVGFLQTGTGAIARDLLDRGKDKISVFDFMTAAQKADVKAGTLLVDVTAAITAADAAASTLRVSAVEFPGGSYLCSSALTKQAGVSWMAEGFGQGAAATRAASAVQIHFNGPTTGAAITIQNPANPGVNDVTYEADLKIQGIGFFAEGASLRNIIGILSYVPQVKIDDCSFTTFSEGIKSNSVQNWITNNYFSSCNICIDYAGGEGHICDNYGFPYGQGTAILIRGSATLVQGNKFFGDGGSADYGIVVWGFGNVIVGNEMDSFIDVGIYANSNFTAPYSSSNPACDQNTIVGNTVSACGNVGDVAGIGRTGTFNSGIVVRALNGDISGNIVNSNSIFNKRTDRAMSFGIRIVAEAGKTNAQTHARGNSIANAISGNVSISGSGTQSLHDVEMEGTWTPALTSAGGGIPTYGTPATPIGNWRRVGRDIFIDATIDWTGFSGGSGAMLITGLPFPSKTQTSLVQPLAVTASNLTIAGQFGAEILSGESQIRPVTFATGAAVAGLAVDTAATIWIRGSYETDK